MNNTTSTYNEAARASIEAENAFLTVAIAEVQRLIPEGVDTLIFAMNDTPRLCFEAFRLDDGEEFDAEDIDDRVPDLYDTLDGIAADMGFHDGEDASNWLAHDPDGGFRFVIERER